MTPNDLQYSPTHEWCLIEGNRATVGVTPHGLKGLGDMVCIELPDVGDDVLHDTPFGEIQGTRGTRDVRALLDGVVAEVNGRVAHNPDVLDKDPYGEGWLIRLKFDAEGRRGKMLSMIQYRQLLGKKK